jgi:hypothetical protein
LFKKHKIEKLFYKRYPFKVCINWQGPEVIKDFYEFRVNKETVEKYQKREIRFRHETDLSIFLKDKATYDEVIDGFQKYIIAVWEPGSQKEEQFLSENNHKKYLVDRLRWNKFRFKVHFNYKKLKSNDYVTRLNAFIKNNDEHVKSKPMLTKFLKNPGWWCAGMELYVDDDKTLVKFLMIFSDVVVQVDEYVLRSGINTLTEVENASIEPTTRILSD